MNKIAAIVVTYNRKDCLANCLDAIRRQTLPPDTVYIVDNHSASDTAEMLLANTIIPAVPEMNCPEDIVVTSQINSLCKPDNVILIKYIYKSENTGSGGGFYTGMKAAYDDGYEWFWMMDDDGFPVEDCAEQLLCGAKKYSLDYANALVVNIDDRFSLSFGLEKGKTNIDDYKGIDIVYNAANPFNSTFINRRVPEKIGFIKKEMFIWGDETEYFLRTVKNGFSTGTVVKSIHYHPKAKGSEKVNLFPFFKLLKISILKKSCEKRYPVYYRNLGYNTYTYSSRLQLCKTFMKFILYFIFRLKFSACMIFIRSFINGCRNRFDQ
jgi:GT2 family glycosyltransferase